MNLVRFLTRQINRKIALVLMAALLFQPVSGTVYAAEIGEAEVLSEAPAEAVIPEEAAPEPEAEVAQPEEPAEEEDMFSIASEEPIFSVASEPERVDNVSYIDENGQGKVSNNVIALSGNETELTPGWYVVSKNIVFQHSVSMNERGEYHIILADGGKMSIEGAENLYGDRDPYSNSDSPVGLGCLYDERKDGINLNIYAQSSENSVGQMYINNESGSTGSTIENRGKVGDAINVDDLTINGGKLNLDADGSSNSYGINSKNLTINGGNLYASGTIHAINSIGNIIINGGSLTTEAIMNDESCAINSTGDITINNGTVTATTTKQDGHAINSTGNIIINGGTVIANTTNQKGYALYSTKDITINDGTINAHTTVANSHALYSEENITINSGNVIAVTEDYDSPGIYADNITINDGDVHAEAMHSGSEGNNFGIFANVGKIIINGGRVTAKGGHAGIYSTNSESPLFLSWKNKTDFVSTNSFLFEYGDVNIESGKTFTDGEGHYYVEANASLIKNLKCNTLSRRGLILYRKL